MSHWGRLVCVRKLDGVVIIGWKMAVLHWKWDCSKVDLGHRLKRGLERGRGGECPPLVSLSSPSCRLLPRMLWASQHTRRPRRPPGVGSGVTGGLFF